MKPPQPDAPVHGRRLSDMLGPRAVPLAVLVVQVLLLGVQRAKHGGDDPIRVTMLDQLTDGTWPGEKFSVAMMVVAAPLNALGRDLDLPHLVADRWLFLLWVVWSLVVTTVLLRHRSVATVATFQVFAFCSMLAPYMLGFNAEAFSALAVSGGLLVAMLGQHRTSRWLGWFVVGVGVANIPAQLPGLLAVVVLLAIRRREPTVLAGAMPAVAMIITEATYARGTLSFSKYVGPESATFPNLPWGTVTGFGYPILFGSLGIVASFGRGLVFYLPLLVVALRRPHDRASEWSWCLAVFVCALIPVYARWWAWFGGLTFGPRFFLLGAVAGAFSAADLLCNARTLASGRRFAVCSLAAFSGWVSIAGVVWGITPQSAYRCMSEDFRNQPMCWYSPEYSSLFAPYWDPEGVTAVEVVFIVGTVVMLAIALAPHVVRSARSLPAWLRSWTTDAVAGADASPGRS